MNETEVARLDVIKLEQFEHARCQIHEVDEFQLEAVRALRSAASHLLAACFDLDEPFGQICLDCADMLHCIYPRLGLDYSPMHSALFRKFAADGSDSGQ